MENEVCICMAEKARKIKHLKVGSAQVGIAQLDEVMEEVHSLGLSIKKEIGQALLKGVKLFNYVPSNASEEYSKSLVEEYCRRYDS